MLKSIWRSKTNKEIFFESDEYGEYIYYIHTYTYKQGGGGLGPFRFGKCLKIPKFGPPRRVFLQDLRFPSVWLKKRVTMFRANRCGAKIFYFASGLYNKGNDM